MSAIQLLSHNPEETMALAGRFAKNLKAGDIICLKGELGAGKTTFTKGLAQALRVNAADVNSPTFILMNYYDGKLPVYHFDFYRLNQTDELSTVDLDEYFYGQGVCVIEWPERLKKFAPQEYFEVCLEHKLEQQRMIKFLAIGKEYKDRLRKMMVSIQ